MAGEDPHSSHAGEQGLPNSENHTTHTLAEGEVLGPAPVHPWGGALRWGEPAQENVDSPALTELAVDELAHSDVEELNAEEVVEEVHSGVAVCDPDATQDPPLSVPSPSGPEAAKAVRAGGGGAAREIDFNGFSYLSQFFDNTTYSEAIQDLACRDASHDLPPRD